MAYKRQIYVKAQGILEQRRYAAAKQQQANRAKALQLCPQIQEIDAEIASFGAEAVRLIGKKGGSKAVVEEIAKRSLESQKERRKLLRSAGMPEDFLEAHHFCSKCGDTGFHDGYYCSCYIELIKKLAREEIAPLALLDASTFEKFDLNYYSSEIDEEFGISPREHMLSVLEECQNFAKKFPNVGGGLLLFGNTGLGKTHLCLAIADCVAKAGFDVSYYSTQNAMNKLEKEHFSRDSGNDTLDEMISADLLVLDDLGAEFITAFTVSQIYNIINSRLIDSKPTVISTNFMPAEIEEKYSQRVVSRIIGALEPIRFIGNDIRQIKAMEN